MICPNPKCGRIVSPFDEKCEHCGTSLKGNPVTDYANKADKIVKDAEARADDVKGQIRSGFKDHTFHNGVRSKQERIEITDISNTKGYRGKNAFHGRGYSKDDILDSGISMQENPQDVLVESGEAQNIIQRVLDRTRIQLEEIKDEIFKTNPHITKNYVWQDKAEKTFLNINWKDNSINAGAYALDRKEVELSEGKRLYGIEINGGYVNFVYAISTAFVFVPTEGVLWDDWQLRKIIKLAKDANGFSSAELVRTIRDQDIKDIKSIGEYAFKLLYRTVGHELGHICYGHIHSGGYFHNSTVTNHGGEFDADSFAYSIIGTSEESEELWLSLIMFSLVQLTIKIMQGMDPWESAHSHPAPIDRFNQAILRFPAFAKKYKINEEWTANEIIKLVKLAEMKPIPIPNQE